MYRIVVVFLIAGLALLINGCHAGPPAVVLPDGVHRVPVNRAPPAPPAPASIAPVPAAVAQGAVS